MGVPFARLQWETNDGTWVDFLEEENDILVCAMVSGKPSVRFQSHGYDYEVNLRKMQQENLSLGSSAIRRIRCASPTAAGFECMDGPQRAVERIGSNSAAQSSALAQRWAS